MICTKVNWKKKGNFPIFETCSFHICNTVSSFTHFSEFYVQLREWIANGDEVVVIIKCDQIIEETIRKSLEAHLRTETDFFHENRLRQERQLT